MSKLNDLEMAARPPTGALWLFVTSCLLLAAGYLVLPRIVLAYTKPDYFFPVSRPSNTVNVSATTCRTKMQAKDWTDAAGIVPAMPLEERTVFPQPSAIICTTAYSVLSFDGTAAIREALTRRVTVDFGENGATLSQFASVLEDALAFSFPIQIDPYLVNEFSIDPNEPPCVLGSFDNLPARSVLSRALATYGEIPLTTVIRDGILLITEKTYAEQNYPETRLYPLPFDDDYQSVIELIQLTVAPTSWNIVGGMGSVMPEFAAGGLVISQTHDVHSEIEQILASREKLLGVEHGIPCTRVYTIMDPSILRDLSSRLADDCNRALGDLADPAAEVSSGTHRLIVRSTSRPFICYAQQMVRAYVGIKQPSPTGGNIMSVNAVSGAGPGGMGGGVF